MDQLFSWIPFYEEFAGILRSWRLKQGDLINFLEELRSKGIKITPFMDKDDRGARFLLKEIDPFTFYGTFNRQIREEQRLGILKAIKERFGVSSSIPADFAGIPILNNQRSWFIAYEPQRDPHDVERLWSVFETALSEKPLQSAAFLAAFDEALKVNYTNVNLTMGLYWIKPRVFLNLDQTNRHYLGIQLPSEGLSSAYYADIVHKISATGKPFPDISQEAYLLREVGTRAPEPSPVEKSYWLVGASWDSADPPDQTARFVDEGVWENGYADKYLEEVKSMQVGDRIAIKAATTQTYDLPFDARGHTVSKMVIKAVGTVVANHGDGRVVEVEWQPDYKPRDWYFYTYRWTVWRLKPDDEYAKRLADFVFRNANQDYAWFSNQWWGIVEGAKRAPTAGPSIPLVEAYSAADVRAEGAFLEDAEILTVLNRLQSKKNLIIQGPPGVGKTFLARKFAYALMEAKDDARIEMVQFHQSYSYEDFVRGYRPSLSNVGGFDLVDGPFLRFCDRARLDLDQDYVFLIDEINRGNLSQVFGELLMLMEADKRGDRYALPLLYPKPGEAKFSVPENLYIIGMMNLADRSLALVDYALRRRFAFFDLTPQFSSPKFRGWLTERNMDPALADLVVHRLTALNEQLRNDRSLGPNYQVGHSFFCPKGENFVDLHREWYERIISTEIGPLLREYWFDDAKKAEAATSALLAP